MALNLGDNIDLSDQIATLRKLRAGAPRNLARTVDATGLSPSGTAADKILAIATIPASTLGTDDQQLKQLIVRIAGAFAANGNNKTLKVIVNPTTPAVGATVSGGTTVLNSGVSTGNDVGFSGVVRITRYGVAGANTQLATDGMIRIGTTNAVAPAPATLTLTESAAITVVVTGNAGTTATDILLKLFEVEGLA